MSIAKKLFNILKILRNL